MNKEIFAVKKVILPAFMKDSLAHVCKSADTSEINFICSDGESVAAYKSLLEYHSPYFKNYFDSKWSKLHPDGKWTTQYKGNLIKAIVNYLYHGTFDESFITANFVIFYSVAAEFQLKCVQELALSIILSKNCLTDANIKGVLQLASLHEDKDLKQHCLAYIKNNWPTLSTDPSFAALCVEDPDLWKDIFTTLRPGHTYKAYLQAKDSK
jgi:hypothetical protein